MNEHDTTQEHDGPMPSLTHGPTAGPERGGDGRAAAAAPLADPEDEGQPLTGEPAQPMRLRPEPQATTRLSRKVLAGIGLVAGAGLGGALIWGLQTRHPAEAPRQEAEAANRAAPDGLNALPKDYTGPVLGAPLPGDLAGPILNARNRGQAVPAPGINTPGASGAQAGQPPVDPAEQRRLQELESSRTARLFAGTETRTASNSAVAPAVMPDLAGLGLAPQPATPSAQDRQAAFLGQEPDRRTLAPDRVMAPPSANVLQAGSVIAAALITGIRSDLPGQITAQVTQNIYDSPTGRILLVPQGARLIGQYDSGIGFGQRRVLLVWNRIVFPNGRSIVLERQPGADAQGFAGLEDGVDFHWGELFKAAGLSTILSVGAEAGASQNDSDIVAALRSGAANSISQTGQQIVQRQLNIQPTLTIRPGFPVRVMVTRDLVLEPYGG